MGRILILDRWLARAELALLSTLLFTMVTLSLYMIIQQTILKSASTSWIDAILKVMVMWLGFMGASLATHYNHHINIEVAGRLVPPSWKKWISVGVNTFSAVVCYLFCLAAVDYVHGEYLEWLIYSASVNYQPAYLIPPLSLSLEAWQVRLILPLAFGLFTLRFSLLALAGIFDLQVEELGGEGDEL